MDEWMIKIALIWSTLTHFEKMQDSVYIVKALKYFRYLFEPSLARCNINKKTHDILAILNNNFAIKTLVDKIV